MLGLLRRDANDPRRRISVVATSSATSRHAGMPRRYNRRRLPSPEFPMPHYQGQIRSKLPHVGTTIFTVMSRLALEHNAINLSQGFPDFDCTQELRDLFTKAINSGLNQYPPMAGVPILRERIAEKMQRLYAIDYDPEHEITVVPGATYGIFTAIAACIRPGDEVILFEPAYDCYEPAITTVGGTPVFIPLELPHYHVDWSKVEAAITPDRKSTRLNSSH